MLAATRYAYTPSLCYNFLPLWQGIATALNIVISENYLGITTLGDVGTSHTELMNAAMSFFVA